MDGAAVHEAAASEALDTADTPLPLPYVVDNDAKRPLPGVQSVFLTGGLMSMHCSLVITSALCSFEWTVSF